VKLWKWSCNILWNLKVGFYMNFIWNVFANI
jgi:hypothetical protein